MTDRHANTEELLALRDGEASEWTKGHTGTCTACSAELFRLEQMRARLRSLPAFTPPRDRWAEIAATAKRERRVRWMRSASGIAAAVLLTALTAVALRPESSSAASDQAALDRAMARSQAYEQTLRALGPEREALSGDAARVVAELEDRLGRIDARLGRRDSWQGQGGAGLWQERAGVLGALVDVRITRAASAGL